MCSQKATMGLKGLIRLFRCTPNLRHLTVHIDELSNDAQFPSLLSSISSLKLIDYQLTKG